MGRASDGGQWKILVKLAVDEFHRDLDALNVMFLRKIDRPLGMLEIESFKGIGGPVSQPPEIQLCTDVLQQDFHSLNLTFGFIQAARREGDQNEFSLPA